MSRNQSIGRWGEQAAADYLCEHGYEIAGRNIRTPYGEIDLVALQDGITVFIEVKARTSKSFGPPEAAVTPRKRAHMLACAEHYAQQHEVDHWQIDVIAVEKSQGVVEIKHFENAVS
jgi:putative endonuclease